MPYQTLAGQRKKRASAGERKRPFFLDTCHAHASDSEVVKMHWPEYYTGE